MNYFEFFELPLSFRLDEAALKRQFYANSRKYHPDFYTLESEEEQTKALELSTLNNEAYKTLSDPDQRMRYLLELKGALGEEGENKLPQSFLMEMMDFNEQLMELQMDFTPTLHQQLTSSLQSLHQQLHQTITPLLDRYPTQANQEDDLKAIKDYYLKKRYLLRIQENLDNFAPH